MPATDAATPLRPCPFCGGTASAADGETESPESEYLQVFEAIVSCDFCGAQVRIAVDGGVIKSEEDARANARMLWQRRAN